MEISFKGKRALVTGASRGIGRAIAVALAKAGAEVVALARSKDALEALCAEQAGISPLVCDLADWPNTREAVKKVLPIHLLVNNAALRSTEPFLEVKQESLQQMFAVNVQAIVNVSQVVAGDLISRNENGAIVNVSSISGVRPFTNLTTYAAAKASLESISRSMGLELGPRGVRTNAVQPQYVDTGISRQFSGRNLVQLILDRVPLGRPSTIAEVVDPVMFLLSDHASMINASMVDVSGGYLTTGP